MGYYRSISLIECGYNLQFIAFYLIELTFQMPEQAIHLIVGLGNPGPTYQDTRHNAGFWFIDRLAHRCNARLLHESKFHGMLGRVTLAGMDVRLLQPLTFMNRSGQAVAAVTRYFGITAAQLLVVHDELDLPPGEVRLKQGGGHAGHNGLRDIMSALGSADFWRLRIGIDHPVERSQVVDYVLHHPNREQFQAIEDVLERAVDSLPEMISGRFPQVMNRLHAKR
jgi:peptidyl-tRNA hydrolase, PTH1 family